MSTKNIKELESLANNGDVGAIYELGQRYFYGVGVGLDYGKAKGYFEVAAERGSSGSNYFLGKIYYNGNGVQTNHLKAKEYFEKSASADNTFSKYYLGKLYYWGDGVEKNDEKAEEYKKVVLGKPIYGNQEAGLEEFYSIYDFEGRTKEYVGELQNKVLSEYKNLFGKELSL